jgi:hypothetical protein
MRIGIVAEGPADLAVVTNILRGVLGISHHEVQPLRPDLYLDETDLAGVDRFGGWATVREECRAGAKIAEFLASPIDDGPRLVVIQIDTAEVHLYEVDRPAKVRGEHPAYADELRARVITKICEWLAARWHGSCCYAVAVEEIDAWVLTIWEPGQGSVGHANPKERLIRAWSDKVSEKDRRRLTALKMRSEYGLFDELSKAFRKPGELRRASADNRSLAAFVESLATWGGDSG